MAERDRIGLIFYNDENWIGGTYYILNLISALATLPESERPELIVFSDDETNYYTIEAIGYPRFEFYVIGDPSVSPHQRRNRFRRLQDFVAELFRTPVPPRPIYCDLVFPAGENVWFKNVTTKMYWLPDLQEKKYPELFSSEQLAARAKWQTNLANSQHQIVFSSVDAQQDFLQLFPNASPRTAVIRFAVTHPDLDGCSLDALKNRYAIPQKYFFLPSQFWAHKNHFSVVKAVRHLKESGHEISVVCTGKEADFRNPDYVPSLKAFILEHNLKANLHLLGFIDRVDQLALLKGAVAVIQPSLFEGWSTSTEDAKALNKFVIASDLAVHREQLGDKAWYFRPLEVHELAAHLLKAWRDGPPEVAFDYESHRRRFAQDFNSLAKKKSRHLSWFSGPVSSPNSSN